MARPAAGAVASTHQVATACRAIMRPSRTGQVMPVRSRPLPRDFHAANVRSMPQRRGGSWTR